ncbi:MAG: hypothetical protein ACLQSX_07985, partial [Smithella sp.]
KMTTKTSVASLRSTGLVSTGINGRFHLEHVADFTGIKTRTNWIHGDFRKQFQRRTYSPFYTWSVFWR